MYTWSWEILRGTIHQTCSNRREYDTIELEHGKDVKRMSRKCRVRNHDGGCLFCLFSYFRFSVFGFFFSCPHQAIGTLTCKVISQIKRTNRLERICLCEPELRVCKTIFGDLDMILSDERGMVSQGHQDPTSLNHTFLTWERELTLQYQEEIWNIRMLRVLHTSKPWENAPSRFVRGCRWNGRVSPPPTDTHRNWWCRCLFVASRGEEVNGGICIITCLGVTLGAPSSLLVTQVLVGSTWYVSRFESTLGHDRLYDLIVLETRSVIASIRSRTIWYGLVRPNYSPFVTPP